MCFVLQLVLLCKVIRAPQGSPLQTANPIPNSLQPGPTRYIRRVGRPRMEWTSTVLREALRVAGGEHKICMTWRRIVTYGWRYKLSNSLMFWGFTIGSTKKTFLPRNRSRKMISGWYSVYPAQNDVARLFRFDGNSGFAKIWWWYESTVFYQSKTSCPRTSLDNGQLLRAIVDTISGF